MTPADNCAALKLALHIHASHCRRAECIALADLREFFAELHEFLDDHMDVDEPEPGVRVMNEAGHLMVRADHLALALGATSERESEGPESLSPRAFHVEKACGYHRCTDECATVIAGERESEVTGQEVQR